MSIRFLTFILTLPLAAAAQRPTHLATDLLEHTERVAADGCLTTLTLEQAPAYGDRVQYAAVRTAVPVLSWQISDAPPATLCDAYEILVATAADKLTPEAADLWRSGTVDAPAAAAALYAGKPLSPSSCYYWTVRCRTGGGKWTPWAEAKVFRTADRLDGLPSRYPLTRTDETPVSRTAGRALVLDFGRDAFASLTLTATATREGDTLAIHLGEQTKDGLVNRHPEGSQRYSLYRLPLSRGTHTYRLTLRHDHRNTTPKANESGVDPILMPAYMGEVTPFRYCEIEGAADVLATVAAVRNTSTYPFDGSAASFVSSDTILNKVWELCRHTIRATSFCGAYVDGDRERIPYEADAIINQLSHYAVDRDYSMARHSVRHLVYNPTWPTEWILQTVIMAWNDYLYTGNDQLLRATYADLKPKALSALRQPNGLISTRRGGLDKNLYASIHFNGNGIRDIVDWPQSGAAGLEKENAGETDGFVFTDYNTVVNAYHYRALCLLAKIAATIGEPDAAAYAAEAAAARKAIRKLLMDKRTGLFRDGADTRHSSLHSNLFALAFGLVDKKETARVVRFIESRKMACSVYAAQFLLDALYDSGAADYALSLMTSQNKRSWWNMLRIGSTITTEAWDNAYKANQDWNHPWGAAPANIITRKLMGIEPLEPGFARISIAPQPATLDWAEARVPTVRGDVSVRYRRQSPSACTLDVELPANTTGEVVLPLTGRRVSIGSGRHTLTDSK